MLKLFLSRITGKTSGVQDLRVTEQLDKQICASEYIVRLRRYEIIIKIILLKHNIIKHKYQ